MFVHPILLVEYRLTASWCRRVSVDNVFFDRRWALPRDVDDRGRQRPQKKEKYGSEYDRTQTFVLDAALAVDTRYLIDVRGQITYQYHRYQITSGTDHGQKPQIVKVRQGDAQRVLVRLQ